MHVATRQANYLSQCFANDKRPLGIFIGAGCPVAIRSDVDGVNQPLIPDIAGLTEVVTKHLSAGGTAQPFEELVSQLTADATLQNVETMLTRIRALQAVAGEQTVRGLSSEALSDLERGICNAIVAAVDKNLPHKRTPYHRVAAWMGSAARSYPVEVFTTNYDLLFEQALEELRVPYFDGFVGSKHTFLDLQAMEVDRLPPRWARLWKLHGSINWCHHAGGWICRTAQISEQKRVIHPSHLKYDQSRRLPYLAMIDRLRAFFRLPAPVMLTSGYSFRDEHLNEVIIQGLEGNPNAAVFALLYGPLDDYGEALMSAQTRPNLSLLAEDKGCIATREGVWTTAGDGETVPPWLLKTEAGADGNDEVLLRLGDFAQLGMFFADMTGFKEADA